MTSIKKLRDGVIKEKKKNKIQKMPQTDSEFEENLEIYGFEKDQYKCYKYESVVEVEDMKVMEDYKIKSLTCQSNKEVIEIEEFVKYKVEMKLL